MRRNCSVRVEENVKRPLKAVVDWQVSWVAQLVQQVRNGRNVDHKIRESYGAENGVDGGDHVGPFARSGSFGASSLCGSVGGCLVVGGWMGEE